MLNQVTQCGNSVVFLNATFERYFKEKEFNTVITRVFGSKTEYFKASKMARINREYLENHGTGILDQEFDKYRLISFFEDANGKKQTWRLRDADPKNTVKETRRILKILTTSSIFQKDSIRRFARFLDYDCKGETVVSSTRTDKREVQQKTVEKSLTPAMTAAGEVQEEGNEQNGKSPLEKSKKMTKAERRLLNNFRRGKKKGR